MKRALWICGITALLTLPGCSSSDSVDSDESLLRFLPEQSSGLVSVDIGGLRENPFALGFIEEHVGIQVPESLQDFTARTGFDPNTSLRKIMGASAGNGEGVMVVSAVYDRDLVTAYLTDEGIAAVDHDGVMIFRPDPARDGSVAFVDDVLLVGSESQVRDAIDRSMGGLTSALDNASLVEDIRTVGDGYQIWATGRIDEGLIPDGLGGTALTQLISSIESGTYQMRIDEMVTARVVGQFSDPAHASTVASLLEGLKGMAMLQGMSGEFADLLAGVSISNNETTVQIELEVDTAALERLAESGALSR